MENLISKLKKDTYKLPFMAGIIIGLITHMTMIVNKYPNGDAMTNFYFDQNMVTSGRWFLVCACGISSFYDLNFVNGLLAVIFMAITAVYVTRFFDVQKKASMILIPAVMVTFPAFAATMAYMYTVDGYMFGLLLAVLAAYMCKKYKFGYIYGAVALAFSIGTYQAYLAVTILLVIFDLMLGVANNEKISDLWKKGIKYLTMGVGGGILYYVILKICLILEKKELDTYQGINEMGKISLKSLPSIIYEIYYDFAAFAFRGRIFVNNIVSMVVMIIIILICIISVCVLAAKSKAYKKWYNWFIFIGFAGIIPLGCNVILLISAKAEYHLLMRMQWVLFLVIAIVLMERSLSFFESLKEKMKIAKTICVILVAVLCYNFMLADNIAYFNLNEKYEKTYAYCVRLLDRIEQTEGYYSGIPVCMVGVVSEESYPSTDVTEKVTARISSTGGDFLLYRGEQYREFIKHYLGATLNILEDQDVVDMYYSEEYSEMESFPAKNSVKLVDGTIYVKLE